MPSDPTAQLPDEVLCSIISFIPSLAHRFKLAAVNNKFRRCVISELNKPMPLNINFCSRTLNGDNNIPMHLWPQVLQVLAPKTCFTQITIVGGFQCSIIALYLLPTLAVSECLDKVRAFELVGFFPHSIPSILADVLTQCPKLSILRLDTISGPGWLRSILANKSLTQLSLKLYDYNQDQLSKLFESLEPNMLQSLDLSFSHMESPNFVDLVSNSGAAWSGLREMRLYYNAGIAVQHLHGLFGTVLPQLHLLQTCRIECDDLQEVPIMTLFNNTERQQPTVVQIVPHNSLGLYGCAAVNLFTLLQQFHPDIQIDFDDEKMHVNLDGVTLVTAVSPNPHGDHCLQCRRVYTVVLEELAEQAEERRSLHLANYRLNRCKVNAVVMDLYVKRQLHQDEYYLPLSAVINEAGDLVVIAFEDEDGEQFYITIDCGHCLSENCIGCVHI